MTVIPYFSTEKIVCLTNMDCFDETRGSANHRDGTPFHVPIIVPEEDLRIRRFKDLVKRKCVDPVVDGTIFIRDLEFLNNKNEDDLVVLEKNFLDWRSSLVEKMDGIQLNLEGFKFRLGVTIPATYDFQEMRKDCGQINLPMF